MLLGDEDYDKIQQSLNQRIFRNSMNLNVSPTFKIHIILIDEIEFICASYKVDSIIMKIVRKPLNYIDLLENAVVCFDYKILRAVILCGLKTQIKCGRGKTRSGL